MATAPSMLQSHQDRQRVICSNGETVVPIVEMRCERMERTTGDGMLSASKRIERDEDSCGAGIGCARVVGLQNPACDCGIVHTCVVSV